MAVMKVLLESLSVSKTRLFVYITLFLSLYTVVVLFLSPQTWVFSSKHWNHHDEMVRVTVLHYFAQNWGGQRPGVRECGPHLQCEWIPSDNFDFLRNRSLDHSSDPNPHKITLGLYHIHSLYANHRTLAPLPCKLQTNITMYESEESYRRFKSRIFDEADRYFEAHSTVHPKSDVQRVYELAFIGKENWRALLPQKNFSNLFKASAYIASDCHREPGDISNTKRDDVVLAIRGLGFRVDGIGKCMHSEFLPDVVLALEQDKTRSRSLIKRDILNHYAFYLAFENFLDDGYVTEKVFEGLMAGTVPVYLGDSKHLKKLLPHPKAVIFLDDFPNIKALVDRLNYLLTHEAAYEEHRAWRKNFNFEHHAAHKPLLQKSWECRICEWSAAQYWLSKEPTKLKGMKHKVTNHICSNTYEPVTS